MMIIKDGYDFYLCDDQNFFCLDNFYTISTYWDYYTDKWKSDIIDFREYYEDLQGYELGTHEYLFDEVKFFEYKISRGKNGATIKPREEFLEKFKAWARDIKINNILEDL